MEEAGKYLGEDIMKVYEGKEPYIFVSYAHSDEEKVLSVIQYLYQQGFRIWYDEGIEAGADWPEYIAEHLAESTCVIAFFSQNAMNSDHCLEEINYARELRKPFLGVYLEEVELTRGMQMRLGRWQALHCKKFANEDKFREKLCEAKLLEPCRTPQDENKPKEFFIEQSVIKTDRNANQKNRSSVNPKKESTNEVGSYITFGHYGPEEIRWRILDKKDDQLLVISEACLDAKPYNTKFESVTWETCTLRKWLNEEFYQKAFTEQERKQISLETIQNLNNRRWNTKGGEETEDHVFLLSIEEAEKYFSSDEERQAKATEYAKEQRCWVSGETGNSFWWLRSPGLDINDAAGVNSGGCVNNLGSCVSTNIVGIRPALWIKF